jgi:hypothetical protein
MNMRIPCRVSCLVDGLWGDALSDEASRVSFGECGDIYLFKRFMSKEKNITRYVAQVKFPSQRFSLNQLTKH